MKAFSSITVAAALLPALAAAQPFWPGAPSCVQSCVSSAWSASSAFPVPTAFCAGSGGPPIASCLSANCGSATPAAVSTFSSLSSSLCSRYSSCVSAGSTGVVTITASGGGPWGPFATNHPSGFGPPGSPFRGPSGTYTFTGCPWATGAPWFIGGGGGPGGFWGSTLPGWAYQTHTTTITTTYTSSGAVVTATGVATVEQAASGGLTSTTTFFDGAQVTGSTSSNAGAGPARVLSLGGGGGGSSDNWATIKIVGVALGAILAVVGML